MSFLIYTFRTNPFIDELEKDFGEVFLFGKLHEDFEIFQKILLKNKPKIVVGIAQSESAKSSLEFKTSNRFNKTKRVLKNGIDEYPLFIPSNIQTTFNVNQHGTDSFCNWAMYRVSNTIAKHSLLSKHMFFHCHPKDVPEILNLTQRSCD